MRKFIAKNQDQLEQDVIKWLFRLTSGEADIEDFSEFAAWQARSPAHSFAYRKVSALWENLGKPLAGWHQVQNYSDTDLNNQHGKAETKISDSRKPGKINSTAATSN